MNFDNIYRITQKGIEYKKKKIVNKKERILSIEIMQK